jgi:hypothetical protein
MKGTVTIRGDIVVALSEPTQQVERGGRQREQNRERPSTRTERARLPLPKSR